MAICEECKKDFNSKSSTRGRFCSLSCSTGHRNREMREANIKAYYKDPKLCKECNEPIDYDKRKNKFCSKSCFTIHENRKRKENGWSHPAKIYNTKAEEYEASQARKIGATGPHCRVSFSTCEITGKPYRSNIPGIPRGRIQFSPYIILSEKNQYQRDTEFKFDVYDYSNYFDLELLEEHGWYSSHDNINGVSRDHMFSRTEGFRLGIDPAIIAHPANCQLMIHKENISKGTNCSITIDNLQKKIENWVVFYSNP